MFTLATNAFSAKGAFPAAQKLDMATLAEQATLALSQTGTARLAVLVGEVVELYTVKSDYAVVVGRTYLGHEIELEAGEHVLGFRTQYGKRELVVSTCTPKALCQLRQRCEFTNYPGLGAHQMLQTTEVVLTALTVRGTEYTPEQVEALLADSGNHDDFSFFGWAVASSDRFSDSHGQRVYVYRLQDGWLQSSTKGLHFRGQVAHHYGYEWSLGMHERYNVSLTFHCGLYDHDLGRPLTWGAARHLDSLYPQAAAIEKASLDRDLEKNTRSDD